MAGYRRPGSKMSGDCGLGGRYALSRCSSGVLYIRAGSIEASRSALLCSKPPNDRPPRHQIDHFHTRDICPENNHREPLALVWVMVEV